MDLRLCLAAGMILLLTACSGGSGSGTSESLEASSLVLPGQLEVVTNEND